MRSVRVVLADDSAVARAVLREALAVTGVADLLEQCADGLSALHSVMRLRPDVLLLDMEMPGMNGLAVLKAVRERSPTTATVMCSTLTRRGAAVTLQALSAGAADYVTKPAASRGSADAVRLLAAQLTPRLRALSLTPGSSAVQMQRKTMPAASPVACRASHPASSGLIVAGASTGGPAALESFFRHLPEHVELPLLVVQHMPEMFTEALAQRLSAAGPVRVAVARDGSPLEPGTALLARGGYNVEVTRRFGRLVLRERSNPREDLCSPSVDAALVSAVECLGAGVTACIMTGMGSDGLLGSREIVAAGGTVLAQTQESSVVWGMPRCVTEAGLAAQQLTPAQMARLAGRISGRSQPLIGPFAGAAAFVGAPTA